MDRVCRAMATIGTPMAVVVVWVLCDVGAACQLLGLQQGNEQAIRAEPRDGQALGEAHGLHDGDDGVSDAHRRADGLRLAIGLVSFGQLGAYVSFDHLDGLDPPYLVFSYVSWVDHTSHTDWPRSRCFPRPHLTLLSLWRRLWLV